MGIIYLSLDGRGALEFFLAKPHRFNDIMCCRDVKPFATVHAYGDEEGIPHAAFRFGMKPFDVIAIDVLKVIQVLSQTER